MMYQTISSNPVNLLEKTNTLKNLVLTELEAEFQGKKFLGKIHDYQDSSSKDCYLDIFKILLWKIKSPMPTITFRVPNSKKNKFYIHSKRNKERIEQVVEKINEEYEFPLTPL